MTKVATVKSSTQTNTKIINKEIFAYTLRRSILSKQLMNVVAVDKKGELLAVVEVDLPFDSAVEIVDTLNADLKEGKA